MAPTASDLDRAFAFHENQATVRAAARQTAHQARVAANLEVRRLIGDVEELIRRIADAADPELSRLRFKVAAAVAATKQTIFQNAERMQFQAKEAVAAADRHVRDRIWRATGISAVAGFVVGFLVGRRLIFHDR
jgi:ElaB/YqjD/DUF883 family membrane-anchored ribosome-binding protein